MTRKLTECVNFSDDLDMDSITFISLTVALESLFNTTIPDDVLVKIWNNKNCAVLLDSHIPAKTLFEMMFEAEVQTCYIEEKLFCKIQNNISPSI